MFDETARQGNVTDHTLEALADALREHMFRIYGEDWLSEKNWRVAGYRFAKSLAQNCRSGFTLTREFMEGMRIFSEEAASMQPTVLYDTKRADSLEEKAEKLLALATHKRTGDAEARNAEHGFVKLFMGRELAILATDRYTTLMQEVSRLRDAINYVKTHHPTIFVWKLDEQSLDDDFLR